MWGLIQIVLKRAPLACIVCFSIFYFPAEFAPEGALELRDAYAAYLFWVGVGALVITAYQIVEGVSKFIRERWELKIEAERKIVEFERKRHQALQDFEARLDREVELFNCLSVEERYILIDAYSKGQHAFKADTSKPEIAKLVTFKCLLDLKCGNMDGWGVVRNVTIAPRLISMFKHRFDKVCMQLDEDMIADGAASQSK